MGRESDTKTSAPSCGCWETMEELARQGIQNWLQGLLESDARRPTRCAPTLSHCRVRTPLGN